MAGDGDGGSSLLRCLDYPCTKRLRLRRLLAYHRRYTHEVYTTYVFHGKPLFARFVCPSITR